MNSTREQFVLIQRNASRSLNGGHTERIRTPPVEEQLIGTANRRLLLLLLVPWDITVNYNVHRGQLSMTYTCLHCHFTKLTQWEHVKYIIIGVPL